MKKYLILIILGLNFQCIVAFGQLTIDSCQEKARNNYPKIKQYDLIEQSEAYSLSNANKGYLPQLAIYAKATYQSDVTELYGVKVVTNDQYQAYAELSQTIWDGGAICSQKKNIKASNDIEKQSIEVDLYAIKDRVNQLFFGILTFNELIAQNDLLQKEL